MLENLKGSNIPDGWATLATEQAAAEAEFLGKENVVGVALGHRYEGGEDTGERAITVLVQTKLPEDMIASEDLIKRGTKTRKGTRVDVQEIGVVQAGGGVEVEEAPSAMRMPVERGIEPADMVGTLALTQRARPVMGGFSVGHYAITAGTIATCCYDLTPFPGIPERYSS
jgi:hypothetical protein